MTAVDPLDDAVAGKLAQQLKRLEARDLMLAKVGGEHEVVVHPIDRLSSREAVLVHSQPASTALRWHPKAKGQDDLIPLCRSERVCQFLRSSQLQQERTYHLGRLEGVPSSWSTEAGGRGIALKGVHPLSLD